jgi:glucose-6-phosphate isomerase
MQNHNKISRQDFMNFFRDSDKLNELTPDDRVEVFSTILLGGSDLTKELLNEILKDYAVRNLEVVEVDEGKMPC